MLSRAPVVWVLFSCNNIIQGELFETNRRQSSLLTWILLSLNPKPEALDHKPKPSSQHLNPTRTRSHAPSSRRRKMTRARRDSSARARTLWGMDEYVAVSKRGSLFGVALAKNTAYSFHVIFHYPYIIPICYTMTYSLN